MNEIMTVNYFKRDQKPSLAYVYSRGEDESLPIVMFCGGYRSDMDGTKAVFLEAQCRARGQGYLRFDYSGHGASEGEFEALTISDWRDDALAVFEELVDRPVVIVGSSMGGWIALLMARALTGRDVLRGVVGIAAAPDFTEEMFHQRLSAAQQVELIEAGIVYVGNDYSDEPYAFTRAFYEDGKRNLVLTEAQSLLCDLVLLQGRADKDVPWQTAVKIQQVYGLGDEAVVFIEGGDHRLSSPEQLDILWGVVGAFC